MSRASDLADYIERQFSKQHFPGGVPLPDRASFVWGTSQSGQITQIREELDALPVERLPAQDRQTVGEIKGRLRQAENSFGTQAHPARPHEYPQAGHDLAVLYHVLKRNEKALSARDPTDAGSLLPWPRVADLLRETRGLLADATTGEQFREVGNRCRGALLALAREVYDPQVHGDPAKPLSNTDADGMIQAFIAAELAGKSAEAPRKVAKGVEDLANALTHDQNANYRKAMLAVEAISFLGTLLAIVTGRFDRTPPAP